MKHKKAWLLAIVLTFIIAAAFVPQKAYALSSLKIVGMEPAKIGNYYYKIDIDLDDRDGDSCYSLYRSQNINNGYKRVAKHIYEVWESNNVCAVDGKYCYVPKSTDDGKGTVTRYDISKKGKKVVKDLPEGYWKLGAAKGKALFLQKGSNIYRYYFSTGKLRKIKSNCIFAGSYAQKGKYVMMASETKSDKLIHTLYRITASGKLQKVKKLGVVNSHPGSEEFYTDYRFVGKKVYYMLDKSKKYVLKRCNLNGSKEETLGVFDKRKSQNWFTASKFTGKNCEISYYENSTHYTYKYIYKTKKLKLIEKY